MAQTHYHPYGGTLTQSTNQGVQTHKFIGKELDTMHGLNMYDFGARQLDPTTGLFTSMDPLCEKYYNISPYSYCAGNPIRYVDPDGRDIFEFDNMGHYTVTKDESMDLLIVNNPWKYNPNGDYELGESKWELSLPYRMINTSNSGEKDSYALLQINGDENGDNVFMFLSEATNVEWSHAKTENSKDGLNYLTCSHSIDNER